MSEDWKTSKSVSSTILSMFYFNLCRVYFIICRSEAAACDPQPPLRKSRRESERTRLLYGFSSREKGCGRCVLSSYTYLSEFIILPIIALFAAVANSKIVTTSPLHAYAHNEKGEFIVREMLNGKEVEVCTIVSILHPFICLDSTGGPVTRI